ncbi:S-layer homology domain-containing protein [Anoxybacillus flavithermus]|uniref:S-layer homology domain-containing protein n=1 Tax=Anoxybacillus flavithermus TaxID=33934 RepID=UPI000A7D378A|nr:S-layer homology domain-containing protein [Anoxybacillus flavithermus]
MAYQPKSYRKFLAGTVSAAVVASAIAPVASASFTDVAGSVHANDIATLVAKGYIKGYADGTFKPNKPLTRGEAAIIFSRILKDAGVKAPEQGAGFPDVPASKAELAEAVAIVKAAGVMGGDEKGNFNPNANITREQMAKVVVEAFKLTKPANHTTKITDLDKAGSWAREYIQTLEANGVTKNTEFMPKRNVTRGEFASFVVRAMDVKKEVSAADITAVKLVDEKTLEVTFNGELKEVKKEDFAIQGVEIESVSIKAAAAAEAKTTVVVIKTKTALQEGKSYSVSYKGQTTDKAKVDVPVVTPKVESVSAINAKTIEVKFNKAVDDTKAKFEVKRGNITANVSKITWNKDKTAAQIELASKLFAGDYTVNVTGLADQVLTGTVKVENEKVAKIEIASDLAVLTGTSSVSVGYKVYNQYGEDITAKTTITATSSSGSASADAAKGVVNITGLISPKAGDKLSLTLVHGETATATSKVLTVSDASKVSEVTIEGLYNADKKELSEDTRDADFYLLINAKDQYGNELKASDLNASSVVVNSSNPLVAKATASDFKEITVDGKKRIALKLDTSTATAGKTTVSIISLASAKVAQYEVEVKEGARVDNFVLSQPELAVAKEKVVLPFEAYDKQGNKVDKYELLNAVRVTSTAGRVAFVKDAKANTTNLVLDLTSVTNPTKVTVTAITPTQKVVNLVVDVKEAAKPVYIAGVKGVTTNVEVGQKFELGLSNIVVKDQYEREFKLTDKVGVGAGQYQIKAMIPSKTVLDFVSSQDTIDANADKIVLAGQAKGTETVTLTLLDNAGNPIAGSEFSFTSRVAAADEYVSYEVKAIDPLYDDSKVDINAASDTDSYVRDVVVYGVLANGQKVVLPSSAYTVTSSTKGIEVIQPNTSHGYQLNVQAAETSGTGTSLVQYAKDATEAKGTAVITINANGKQLTQEFTITQAKPQVASVKFDKNRVDNGVANVADSSGNISAANLFALVTGATVEDQYGETVTINSATGAITFADTTTASSSILVTDYTSVGTANHTIVGNGTASVAISGADNGETFKATFNFGGYQVPVKVVVGD